MPDPDSIASGMWAKSSMMLSSEPCPFGCVGEDVVDDLLVLSTTASSLLIQYSYKPGVRTCRGGIHASMAGAVQMGKWGKRERSADENSAEAVSEPLPLSYACPGCCNCDQRSSQLRESLTSFLS